MSTAHRLRLVALGVVLWVLVTALGMAHYPFSATLGAMHAGMAAAVAALGGMPRTMLRWV